MLKYMEELSQSEAAAIKKTIQELFKQTCILQVKYEMYHEIDKVYFKRSIIFFISHYCY